MRPAGDVLGFALFMGDRLRRDVRVLRDRGPHTARCRRAFAARNGDGAVLLVRCNILGASLGPVGTGLASDYFTFQAASVAGAVQPLGFGALMTAEFRSLVGEAKGFDVRALEPFRAQGLHTALDIVPTLETILAAVLFAASRTVKKDVARLHAGRRSSGDAARTS